MSGFIEGEDRNQATLFPERLDDYIADFRKDNGVTIRLVCREFVMLCRKVNLFTQAFVADRGYFMSEEILACEDAGIETYLPKPQTSGNQAKGQFGRDAFRYITGEDEYECPAGERLDRNPDAMRIRRATVEHPFGRLTLF